MWSTPFSSGTTIASPTFSGGASMSAWSSAVAFGVTQSTSVARSRYDIAGTSTSKLPSTTLSTRMRPGYHSIDSGRMSRMPSPRGGARRGARWKASLKRQVVLRGSTLYGQLRASSFRHRPLVAATVVRQHGDRRCGGDEHENCGERVAAAAARRPAPRLDEQRVVHIPHEATITSTMLNVKIDRDEPLGLHEQVAAELRRAI